ncbi:hypothetical protein QBC45DRAFT_60467 [Copromyces sp. CBS 386.78]|nr:hypothetical protein QBC45DRAFT_60467 [Copromyces sp. CBS 386.78]
MVRCGFFVFIHPAVSCSVLFLLFFFFFLSFFLFFSSHTDTYFLSRLARLARLACLAFLSLARMPYFFLPFFLSFSLLSCPVLSYPNQIDRYRPTHTHIHCPSSRTHTEQHKNKRIALKSPFLNQS